MQARRSTWLRGALLGVITSLPLLALFWMGGRLAGLPQAPFDIFDAVGRWLPGPLVTFGIDRIVDLVTTIGLGSTDQAAKTVERAMALSGPLLFGIVLGAVLSELGRRGHRPMVRLSLAGASLLLLLALAAEVQLGWPPAGPVASSLWLTFLILGWGWLLGRAIEADPRLAPTTESLEREEEVASETDADPHPSRGPDDAFAASRRGFLLRLGGGALAVVAAALGLGSLLGRDEADGTSGAPERPDPNLTSGPAASPPEPTLQARFDPTPGTRPEITPNEDYYRIDINTTSPRVDEREWQLEIGGLVGSPMSLTLRQLQAMESVSQVVTMACISNRIGGDLISTTRFTGVPLRDVLARAELEPSATHLFVESTDGFFETVEPADMEDPRTLLVYAMNGQPLPAEHGFPLRIYIPDRYGMKQPKWIERLTAIDQFRPGYWVERGWSREARPKVVSMVDDVATDMMLGDPDMPALAVGGIAWAGARGIERVEVQVDDGPWQEAQLRQPPLSPLSWVQWRYEWTYEAGRHSFRVRATDGEGNLQILEPSGARPDGATGVHELMTTV